MAEPDDVLSTLEALKAEYERTEAALDQLKGQIVETAIDAFKQGKEAADIYARSPLSHVWLRAQVREAGIPRAKPGTKPRARRHTTQPATPTPGVTPKPKKKD
jgi:hypothetical protein